MVSGLVAGCLALVSGIFIATSFTFDGAQASVASSRLTFATVQRGALVRDVAADGLIVAAVSPTLYSGAAGTISLKINAGDPVAKGQLLAVIESPDLGAKHAQDVATLESLRIDLQRAQLDAEQKLVQLSDALQRAEVDLKTAQREYERSQKAYQQGAYSELQTFRAQDALQKAQFVFDQATKSRAAQPRLNRFDVDSRRALLERQNLLVADLKRQLEQLHVRSPVDGQIGQVLVADRASLPKDAPLFSVVDLSALEVEIKVAEYLARDLKPGMAAEINGDGRSWQGLVRSVSPQVVNGQVVARVRFADQRLEGLRQNQRLAVRILIERREDVLTVERGTFLDQQGGGVAYLVQDNVAKRHPISVGATSLAKIEILDGLKEGDRIVVSGTDAFNGADRAILSNY